MDPQVIEWCRKHPPVMEALDGVADRYGQSIEVAFLPVPGEILDKLVVRYAISKDVIGVIYPDGRFSAA